MLLLSGFTKTPWCSPLSLCCCCGKSHDDVFFRLSHEVDELFVCDARTHTTELSGCWLGAARFGQVDRKLHLAQKRWVPGMLVGPKHVDCGFVSFGWEAAADEWPPTCRTRIECYTQLNLHQNKNTIWQFDVGGTERGDTTRTHTPTTTGGFAFSSFFSPIREKRESSSSTICGST